MLTCPLATLTLLEVVKSQHVGKKCGLLINLISSIMPIAFTSIYYVDHRIFIELSGSRGFNFVKAQNRDTVILYTHVGV